jgi:hypothetical protein
MFIYSTPAKDFVFLRKNQTITHTTNKQTNDTKNLTRAYIALKLGRGGKNVKGGHAKVLGDMGTP